MGLGIVRTAKSHQHGMGPLHHLRPTMVKATEGREDQEDIVQNHFRKIQYSVDINRLPVSYEHKKLYMNPVVCIRQEILNLLNPGSNKNGYGSKFA